MALFVILVFSLSAVNTSSADGAYTQILWLQFKWADGSDMSSEYYQIKITLVSNGVTSYDYLTDIDTDFEFFRYKLYTSITI